MLAWLQRLYSFITADLFQILGNQRAILAQGEKVMSQLEDLQSTADRVRVDVQELADAFKAQAEKIDQLIAQGGDSVPSAALAPITEEMRGIADGVESLLHPAPDTPPGSGDEPPAAGGSDASGQPAAAQADPADEILHRPINPATGAVDKGIDPDLSASDVETMDRGA